MKPIEDKPLDAMPEIVSGEEYLSPHDMTEDVDPAYAGDYELIWGCIRIPSREMITIPSPFPGGPTHTMRARGKVYRRGVQLHLNHLDGYRMLQAGVVKRIDGKKPDSAPPIVRPDGSSCRVPNLTERLEQQSKAFEAAQAKKEA